MNPRRAALGAVVAVGLVGLVAVSRDEVAVGEASFASLGAPTMPFVPTGSFITSSWFCGGVPAGEDDVGGLEVRRPDGRWLTVPCRPATWLVHVGELLQFVQLALRRRATEIRDLFEEGLDLLHRIGHFRGQRVFRKAVEADQSRTRVSQ